MSISLTWKLNGAVGSWSIENSAIRMQVDFDRGLHLKISITEVKVIVGEQDKTADFNRPRAIYWIALSASFHGGLSIRCETFSGNLPRSKTCSTVVYSCSGQAT